MISIDLYREQDWPEVWALLQPIFATGETFAQAPDITETAAHRDWIEAPQFVHLARDETGQLLGISYVKPNQPGLGAHVCNAGYATAQAARGRGIASLMCEQSQDVARAAGFRAMQYNLVAASNEGAVRLWQRHGFEIVGTLPSAFHNQRLGYVDAHVMYKTL